MKESRPIVVLLTPGFPRSETDTFYALPSVQNLVKALASRNPSVAFHVVSFHLPFKAETYSWHGATVYALGGKNKRFPARIVTWLRAASKVSKLIASHRVIALHSLWLAECTYVASWLARRSGIPHIASVLGQDALPDNPYLKRIDLANMTITACSQNAATAFHGATGRVIAEVVPIGLDPEAIGRPNSHERTIDIVGVGSLSPIKDYTSFLWIVGELHRQQSNLRCVIIGDGPERPELEGYVKSHGLEGVVRLAGHLPREKVLEALRQAKIFLHTSRYEGQGYVFLEALAAGARVVCRDVGYAGNGDGVYRCESNEEMVAVLRKLLGSTLAELQADVMSVDATALAFERLYGLR